MQATANIVKNLVKNISTNLNPTPGKTVCPLFYATLFNLFNTFSVPPQSPLSRL